MSRIRRSDLHQPHELLDQIFSDSPADEELSYLQSIWRLKMPSAIAENSSVTGFIDGRLVLVCSDATWAHELNVLSPQLLEKFNQLTRKNFPGINSIDARAS